MVTLVFLMREDFGVEITEEGVELNRDNVEHLEVSILDGLCAADLCHPSGPRDSLYYREKVLAPLIYQGKVCDGSDGPFDDRKFRLDSTSIERGVLKAYFGITHYHALEEDIHRTFLDTMALQERGKREFNDPYAFFSRAIGVTAAPISCEGSVFLGERKNKNGEGLLHVAGGYVDYHKNLHSLDLKKEALREMEEEFGILPSDIRNLIFVGVYRNLFTGEVDFTYLAFTYLPNTYFLSDAWRKRAKDEEHKSLIKISGYEDLTRLVDHGIVLPHDEKKWELMYSARGALMSIQPDEIGL